MIFELYLLVMRILKACILKNEKAVFVRKAKSKGKTKTNYIAQYFWIWKARLL